MGGIVTNYGENESAITLKGTVEDIVFSNSDNGYTVFDMLTRDENEPLVTVVGEFPFLEEGEIISVKGEFCTHPSFGRQFKAESYEKSLPDDAESLLKYLSSGAVKGIGPVTAKRIVDRFGDSSLDVIANNPQWLCDIKGITKKRADAIAQSYSEQFGMHETIMFCTDLFGPSATGKIYRRYGPASVAVIKENPYALCDKIPGIGFKTADSAALKLGFDKSCRQRLRAGIVYALQEAAFESGHTRLPFKTAVETCAKALELPRETVSAATEEMISTGELPVEEFDGDRQVFLPIYYEAEKHAAQKLKILAGSKPLIRPGGIEKETERLERKYGFTYNAEQKNAIKSAVTTGVTIITGGPGTGKTTVIRAVTDIFSEMKVSFALTAPTGRAAKRISESCGFEAKTVHRLLETEFDESGELKFTRDAQNPLPFRAIIADEMSMADSLLFASLLDAIKDGSYVILIGDPDQLPPVGAGNALADVIASGKFNSICLKEIFRQTAKSLIITNAHRINEGIMPILNVTDNDFFFIKRDSGAQAADVIVQLCSKRLPKAYNVPPSEIQVISPTRNGEAGTLRLNEKLQNELNPPSRTKKEKRRGKILFREGDKVMQTRNNYDLEWVKDGVSGFGIFNGDMGRIIEISPKSESMTVDFDGRITVCDFSAADDIEPAYAVTVHKSQGSEYTIAVIPVIDCPVPLKTRNLLYTAVTRAKSKAVLVGDPATVRAMVQNNKKAVRFTGLTRFINQSDL